MLRILQKLEEDTLWGEGYTRGIVLIVGIEKLGEQ